MLHTYRKSDAVIIVCQNNASRRVEISGLNAGAEMVLGYSSQDLAGSSISTILPERIAESLKEYIEFNDSGTGDFAEVLGKTRSFHIKNRAGIELPFQARVVRCEPMDNNPWFHLVLVDEATRKRSEAFRQVLHENFKGHEVIDDRTGLPDRASLLKDLQLTLYHANSKDLKACFAVLFLDQFNEVLASDGTESAFVLHQHVALACRQKLRNDDTIGSMADNTLGIILMESSIESARIVFNRLRWGISSALFDKADKTRIQPSVTIVFCAVEGSVNETDIVDKCEIQLSKLRDMGEAGNGICEITVAERRKKGEDRRTKQMPIIHDRRKGDRRTGE